MTTLAAEHLCYAYHAHYRVEMVHLRYFSVFGPRQRPDMAFTSLAEPPLTTSQSRCLGTGNQTRDVTFVGDVMAATRAAAEPTNVAGEVFNVGGGSHITLRSTLELISQFAGRELDIRYLAREPDDVQNTLADVAHARRSLGFEARVGFEEGLLSEFEWVAQDDGSYS